MAERETNITTSQIAQLAGVSSSAVSNWRRRHDDFPRPVASAPGARDLFRLGEVESWLGEHGRLDPDALLERSLFRAADELRADVGGGELTDVLCAAIALIAWCHDHGWELPEAAEIKAFVAKIEDERPELRGVFTPIVEVEPSRASSALAVIADVPVGALGALFEDVLRARRGRFETETSVALTDLIAEIAGHPSGTVFDPAAGEGGFLLALALARERDPEDAQDLRLLGQEKNVGAWRIAKQRFLVFAAFEALVELGDSLLDDKFPDLRADLVVCDPPYGQRIDWAQRAEPDRRWILGRPETKVADLAWVQHVVAHLSEDGRGYVLQPQAALFRGGRDGGHSTGAQPEEGRSRPLSHFLRRWRATPRFRSLSSSCVRLTRASTRAIHGCCSSTPEVRRRGAEPRRQHASEAGSMVSFAVGRPARTWGRKMRTLRRPFR